VRILFVADGRSPITLNWIRHWVERGDEVHLVSTFTCQPEIPLASLHVIPVALSGLKNSSGQGRGGKWVWGARMLGPRMKLRHWLGPLGLPKAGQRLRSILEELKPDFVHAMRIPYEGMLAAESGPTAPLLVSVWGNDFTLHASASPLMRHYTEWSMKAAVALHADCRRDVRLARNWGFSTERPAIVLPGNGGVDLSVFQPPKTEGSVPTVINPRGWRGYVRNDCFFQAIPLVLKEMPEVRFVCPAMAGEPQALRWIHLLKIEEAVELLPMQSQAEMAERYRKAQVLVSPSTHDGTPNSLLEGMACGCFPIAGDLESIREWITSGRNGLLINPADTQALAEAILRVLRESSLRAKAAEHNATLVAERADYRRCMAQAEKFYSRLISKFS
jgi:glycosyltransferase involved in cell wall biosynthesis